MLKTLEFGVTVILYDEISVLDFVSKAKEGRTNKNREKRDIRKGDKRFSFIIIYSSYIVWISASILMEPQFVVMEYSISPTCQTVVLLLMLSNM